MRATQYHVCQNKRLPRVTAPGSGRHVAATEGVPLDCKCTLTLATVEQLLLGKDACADAPLHKLCRKLRLEVCSDAANCQLADTADALVGHMRGLISTVVTGSDPVMVLGRCGSGIAPLALRALRSPEATYSGVVAAQLPASSCFMYSSRSA